MILKFSFVLSRIALFGYGFKCRQSQSNDIEARYQARGAKPRLSSQCFLAFEKTHPFASHHEHIHVVWYHQLESRTLSHDHGL